MKKVFLLFGIAAFSPASAQQKNVFDINRHIQEVLRNKSSSGTIPKTFKTDKTFIAGLIHSQPKQSYTLPNGDKVHVLSGDNMPCVIPEMMQFTTMPNISNPNEYFETLFYKQYLPGSIPNAVKPYRLIASK
jgi:hypothetical protein